MTKKLFLSGIFTIAIVDAIIKIFANKWLPDSGSYWFIDFFLYKNKGIAFSINIPMFIIVAISIILILILIFFTIKKYWTESQKAVGAIAITLGAINNLIDRLIHGYTTDYIIFFQKSAINLSDILIVFGVLMILYYTENKQS